MTDPNETAGQQRLKTMACVKWWPTGQGRRRRPYPFWTRTLNSVIMPEDREEHWDAAYRSRGARGVSWFQAEPVMSLQMIQALGIDPTTAVIDVGGGASSLVDHLVADGFLDVSVLDLSDVALDEGRARLGVGGAVTWLHQDILTWRPIRRFGLWHDRAVFHFLTEQVDQETYLAALADALEPGSGLVLATFAPEGPEFCSGLPVARYSTKQLLARLGEGFVAVEERREEHVTPAGVIQPFSWLAARRDGDHPGSLS